METCKLCNQKMKFSLIREHYIRQHNRFIDQCPFCEKYFQHTESFKQHLISEVSSHQPNVTFQLFILLNFITL